ncbi:dolichol-phosphate mannosyltransferase [Terasakiella brassicae]|uniref:Dolichol-phosphate mannosyltransferase n=1 Tax=Terasakiella brassicae TaxID=1634917 RepID=A0A917C3Z1_9PROT|nr:glycosyltransferase family 2 protein [Terasakiella brassicae]GGF69550.1 dolichol-phosphate mannosyltransferase [Terasakiella brassicae]
MITTPEMSVVVPVKNEAENIQPLIEEICAALAGKISFEIVYVDDGSDDDTPQKLRDMQTKLDNLRVVTHRQSCGQSTAVRTGVKQAQGRVIATLDGDGQNDPADIPALYDELVKDDNQDFLLMAGWRAKRHDSAFKLWQSRNANKIRAGLLGDNTPDTGCGLKVFTREAFLDLPYFNHMHRFLPALMIRRGGRVQSVQVNHRARERGVSKYGMWNRLWVGIVDIMGVMWLQSRGKVPEIVPSKEDA